MSLKLLGKRSIRISLTRSRPGIDSLPLKCRCFSGSSSSTTSSSPPQPSQTPPSPSSQQLATPHNHVHPSEESALSRRFTAMANDALTASPRRASKIAAENPFSENLRREFEDRIASTDFKSTHASAIASANLPDYAPKHTRDLASTPHWTGTESTPDSVLRMLVDTHKPLRGDLAKKSKTAPSVTPANIDLRPTRTFHPKSDGHRIGRAREKTAEYTLSKDASTEIEREEIRHMFRERFLPKSRAVASLNALTSLADEKIEEARQRGAFKNLSNRGKPLERDHHAESPFLNTTEYLLNRIIKSQDIVPPWIEKQQELTNTIKSFRERLRVNWRRHVSRSIAADGGGLEEQCQRAERYAAAEEQLRRMEERTKKIENGQVGPIEEGPVDGPIIPFRDLVWEKTEASYHKLAIENLNSATRSYNLMAPELAKKTYVSLERELKNCYRECAPLISGEIRDRATRPRMDTESSVGRKEKGGILESLGGVSAAVYDSKKPNYGFKEFWRDVWGWKEAS